MENNQIPQWKSFLKKTSGGQVIRIFRPKEIHFLIENADIRDESSFTGSRDISNLQESGLTNEDVKAWFGFLLYTGTRFAEACLIHRNPDLYQGNGVLEVPFYRGKEKRTVKTRNIFLSYKGREVMRPFFEAKPIPSDNMKEITQTLISLTTIMHKAGERINLPSQTFLLYRKKWLRNPDGTFRKDEKGKKMYEEPPPEKYTTNGCSVRSFRKTWESWLYLVYATDMRTESKVMLSQGHTKETALGHYLSFANFDEEDIAEIKKEIEGFGIIG